MNMKASRWFIGAGVALLIAAAFAVRFGPHIYHRFIRRDVQGLGGCVLVYEVDRQRSPAPDSLDTLTDALRQRLRSAGLLRAEVRPLGIDRVQIEIPRADPRSGDDLREQVAVAKELATLVGRLEFRIAANDRDDPDAVAQARAYIDGGKRGAELDRAAREGKPPPEPSPEGGQTAVRPDGRRAFRTSKGTFTYSWVEVGPEEQRTLQLSPEAQPDPLARTFWQTVAAARNKTVVLAAGEMPVYSRDCQDQSLSEEARKNKGPEYFVLLRDPEVDARTGQPKVIGRSHLRRVSEGLDRTLQPAVDFMLDEEGGDLFHALSSQNTPTGPEENLFYRHLAIVLDGRVLTAPRLMEPIGMNGQISGNLTAAKVRGLVTVLQGRALPAVLKPVPVSETFSGEEPRRDDRPPRSKLFGSGGS